MKKLILLSALGFVCFGCSSDSAKTPDSPEPVIDNSAKLAENAPEDKPVKITKDLKQKLDSIIAESRKTLPGAKKYLLKGLNKGEAFFLTIDLKEENKTERVFVRVTKWNKESVSGIVDGLTVLQNYKNGQEINFEEKDVLDWTITKPDGTEEGNYLGKYLDQINR